MSNISVKFIPKLSISPLTQIFALSIWSTGRFLNCKVELLKVKGSWKDEKENVEKESLIKKIVRVLGNCTWGGIRKTVIVSSTSSMSS